jgi:hypothetical protein
LPVLLVNIPAPWFAYGILLRSKLHFGSPLGQHKLPGYSHVESFRPRDQSLVRPLPGTLSKGWKSENGVAKIGEAEAIHAVIRISILMHCLSFFLGCSLYIYMCYTMLYPYIYTFRYWHVDFYVDQW